MPKIKITEVDNTSKLQLGAVGNVVYVPLVSTTASAPVLVSTVTELDNLKNKQDVDGHPYDYTETEVGYEIVKHLLELGMQVLCEGVADAGKVSEESWKRLEKNKSLYNVRFLTTGQFANPTKAMIECAAHRGDCVALLDHPVESSLPKDNGKEGEEKVTYTYVEKVRMYFDKLATTPLTTTNASPVDSFAAAFTPWFTSTLDEEHEIPASFGYLFAYAWSIQNNPTWYAVAGPIRGQIPELVKVAHEITDAEVEILQARSITENVDLDGESDNVGRAINAIANVKPQGYVIWGNRTFIDNKQGADGKTGDLKASAFLNVRNLVSELKKTLFLAAKKYTFEQNSDVLWINFKSEITPLLDKMQSGNGIFGYRIIKQQTNKKARLKAKIVIIPIEAVEDFELEVALEDSLEVNE